jgi:hypothetical protein
MVFFTRFITKKQAADLTGFSPDTLKKWRLSGKLTEGIHWIRVGDSDRVVRYNEALLIDFLQNQSDCHAHQRAIGEYLASLPSNQKKRAGRKPSQAQAI